MPTPAFAALFDMDGVLVDNTDFHINAWIQFAHHNGLTLTRDQYVEHIKGHVSADSMAYVFGHPLSATELTQRTEEKEHIYRTLYLPHRQPLTGLLDFLTAMQAAGVPMAVGTSAPESNIGFTVPHCLRQLFLQAQHRQNQPGRRRTGVLSGYNRR